MTLPKYLDFDLSIEKSAVSYRARVLNSPGGQGSAEFTLPFSELEIENLLLKMGHTRAVRRGRAFAPMDAAKKFGSELFRAVFVGDVGRCWESSLSTADSKSSDAQKYGLRLRLRLNDAPDLSDLPWELLFDSALGRFFNHSNETPLVRFLDLPAPPRPLTATLPLKILVMVSLPRDQEELNADAEWKHLKTALAELETRGTIIVERVEGETLSDLQKRLRRDTYHIFHFIGHGAFDAERSASVLMFEGAQGRSRQVDGQMLGTLLHDHRTLRLVLLNACEGGRSGLNDPFGGVAQNLIRQGIPAVVAMQFAISDDAALKLSSEFYRALADNYPIDAALSEARKAIYLDGNEVEWATPVLYMRAPDGVIFDLSAAPVSTQKTFAQPTHPQLDGSAPTDEFTFDELVSRAQRLRLQGERILADTPLEQEAWQKKFQAAQAYLERAEELQPNHPPALLMLLQTRARLEAESPERARDLARYIEDVLGLADDAAYKRLLAQTYLIHATLTEPANENLLQRAGSLALEANDLELANVARRLLDRLEKGNARVTVDLFGNPDVRFRAFENKADAEKSFPAQFAHAALEFNPIGKWKFQIRDEGGSDMLVDLMPNGTFQLQQRLGTYRMPVNGDWNFNPLTQVLSLNGVVNTFQPFTLSLTLTGTSGEAFIGVSAEGVTYFLTRA